MSGPVKKDHRSLSNFCQPHMGFEIRSFRDRWLLKISYFDGDDVSAVAAEHNHTEGHAPEKGRL